jgi:phosphate:Na+ symporter
MIAMTVIKNMGMWAGLWESVVDSGVIANFQTIFNLITAVVLLPFTGILVNIACTFVKDDVVEEKIYPEMALLDKKLMTVPRVALGEVTQAIVMVAKVARENLTSSLEQLISYDETRKEAIYEGEDRLDQFTDSVDNFLIELSGNIDNETDNRYRNMLMQCARDVERIGDYAMNIEEMAEKMHRAEFTFSEGARKELEILEDAVLEILRLTLDALELESDSTARRIEPLEEVIDDMVLLLKDRHTDRLCEGLCSIDSGLVYLDVLTYLERVADQCSSIAMLMLGQRNVEIMKNHHLYLEELHASGDQSYVAEHQNRKAQYLVPLQQIQSAEQK